MQFNFTIKNRIINEIYIYSFYHGILYYRCNLSDNNRIAKLQTTVRRLRFHVQRKR